VSNTPVAVPVGPAAVQVYTPAVVGRPHAVIHNAGPATVYLGQVGVTAATGLPLPPKAEVALPFANVALYAACGGLTLSGTVTSNVSTAVTGGTSTTVVVGSTTGFAAGQAIQVGSGANAEILTVITASGGVITPTTKPTFDHVVGEPVTLITGASPGTVKVVAGTS
jgi:hypothetical protein